MFAKQELPEHKKVRAERDARRAQLLAMSVEQLGQIKRAQDQQDAADRLKREGQAKAKAAAKAATKEAAKFYNRPEAVVDFAYWSKMDYWTFDEAVALLVGRNPEVLTPRAMKKHLSPSVELLLPNPQVERSEFERQYERLVQLAQRATAMQGNRLRPASVLLWAAKVNVVSIPSELVTEVARYLSPPTPSPLLVDAPASIPANLPDAEKKVAVSSPSSRDFAGREKARWTDEELARLESYHAQHGTKKTAAQFGISDTRVRQLRRERKDAGQGQPRSTPGPFDALLGKR